LKKTCLSFDLGLVDYSIAWQLQLDLVRLRQQELIPDILLYVQHPPVITLGRSSKPEHLLVSQDELARQGVSVHAIERGGDVTYHGPGQQVVYPIFQLKQYRQDLIYFLRSLEEIVIQCLACYNVAGCRNPGYTGVWVDTSKICAIGIAVKRWISYHGLAFNLNSNLEHFQWIVPCGIHDKGVTSLAQVLHRPIDEEQVRYQMLQAFNDVFQFDCSSFGKMDSLRDLIKKRSQHE
jgi:lipoate-protein ligase B